MKEIGLIIVILTVILALWSTGFFVLFSMIKKNADSIIRNSTNIGRNAGNIWDNKRKLKKKKKIKNEHKNKI